jgi:hypothetical protein
MVSSDTNNKIGHAEDMRTSREQRQTMNCIQKLGRLVGGWRGQSVGGRTRGRGIWLGAGGKS